MTAAAPGDPLDDRREEDRNADQTGIAGHLV